MALHSENVANPGVFTDKSTGPKKSEVFQMERLLTDLFALQRFAGNGALQAVIDEVEGRYGACALDDEALANLSAAGDPYSLARDPRDGDERP